MQTGGRIRESTLWLSEPFGSPKDAETTLRQRERSNSARRHTAERGVQQRHSIRLTFTWRPAPSLQVAIS
jgi:hypothetical protein